ncbi:hypothetical protein [Arcticibacterium luteifluviistationis]|uniref:PD-(D/E)XK endonuclease-like domain-containing protein n=1 Tax=Arcticibacterium luteifluviistationis TaxID=1784714 RepID=A0A2Z4GCV6_9BACT|nr:hypothetical protein [Arcticibacterium luteifluviistationis]AWV98991.1 hypothetical protein DJ013_12765 [Arcticibacterium luteifluviistationis]
MFNFNFYPTLLNEYHRYLKHPTEESKTKLLNRINRIPETDPTVLARFKKGISFESAVVKNKPGEFNQSLIEEAAALLPKKKKTQQLLTFQHKNIKFYGYADVLGEARVIDLKSTANHKAGRHDFNYQTLYLYSLIDAGFKSMEYIICDFENIYVETYKASTYDFDSMLTEMESFRDFLLDNKSLIRDKKIMVERAQTLFD